MYVDTTCNDFIKEVEAELIHGRASNMQELQRQFSSRFPENCCKEVIKNKEDKIFIHCSECSADNNSVYCVPCYLNGNHEGHHAYVVTGCTGCCDCGDINEIKEEGFCKIHKHTYEKCNHLSAEELSLFTKVFTKVGGKFSTFDENELVPLIEWIKSFNNFGDEVMNCVISAIEPYITEELLCVKEKFPLFMDFILSISKINAATDILFPKLIYSFCLLFDLYPEQSNLRFALFKKQALVKYASTHPNWPSFLEAYLENNLKRFNNSLYQGNDIEPLNVLVSSDDNVENKKKAAVIFAKYLAKIEDMCKIKRVFGDMYDANDDYTGLVIS